MFDRLIEAIGDATISASHIGVAGAGAVEIATSGSGDTAFRVPLDVANLLVASSGGADAAPTPTVAVAPKEIVFYMDGKVRNQLMPMAATRFQQVEADSAPLLARGLTAASKRHSIGARWIFGYLQLEARQNVDTEASLRAFAETIMVDGVASFTTGSFFLGKSAGIPELFVIRNFTMEDKHKPKLITAAGTRFELKVLPESTGAMPKGYVLTFAAASQSCSSFVTNMELVVVDPTARVAKDDFEAAAEETLNEAIEKVIPMGSKDFEKFVQVCKKHSEKEADWLSLDVSQ
jgi:hypothetical protein